MRGKATTWGWAIGLSVVLALFVGVASAKKPPKPPPEPSKPGEIYFCDDGWYVISPDGGKPTALDITGGQAPSNSLHNGMRWFLRHDLVVGGGTYPDGNPRRQLYAVSEDGEQEVQLTDDTSVEFVLPSRWGDQVIQWVPGDQAVSYVAGIWDEDEEEIVEAGIYKLPIAYDGYGNPSGSNGEPVLVVGSSVIVDGAGRSHVRAERGHAWSPDGTRIVFCNWDANAYGGSDQEVRVVNDIDDPYESTLLTETTLVPYGPGPDWSVNDDDDDVIVYASDDHWATLELLDPDSGSRTTLIQVERRAHDFLSPSFSPDGAWIAYCDNGPENYKKNPDYVSEVYVVSVSDARTTKLTVGETAYWR
jgi:hypothetical protein